MSFCESSDPKLQYKVRDLSLSVLGRKEIMLAEKEMPGLMALRERHATDKPLAGVRITGSLHMTTQAAVLMDTLTLLGADIRWASCNIFSTRDTSAAAMVVGAGTPQNPQGVPVFAWKGESLDEYWECCYNATIWPDGSGPMQLLDDGGDATMLLMKGLEFEKAGAVPDPAPNDPNDYAALLRLLKRVAAPGKWARIVAECRGVTEETTTGVHRLYRLEANGQLPFTAINVNDSVTKSKFDNTYGCRHSLIDGINRATDVMIAGKLAIVCGYGEVGKGCAQSLRGQGARVVIAEIDPICALQAAMEGYQVRTVDEVVKDADIFVTATGNMGIITVKHMEQMKDKAIVGNIGHFDNEIDTAGLAAFPGIVRVNIKPQFDMWTFPDGHSILMLAEGRLLNLGCASGHPSFVMSMSFTNQVLAQIKLVRDQKIHEKKVYLLSKELDEEVARLHLASLDVHLTELTKEQAEYLGVGVKGPYKRDDYRY